MIDKLVVVHLILCQGKLLLWLLLLQVFHKCIWNKNKWEFIKIRINWVIIETNFAWTITVIFPSLNVAWFDESIVTSNLGSTYSATCISLLNVWLPILAIISQFPKTGDLESSNSPLNIPWCNLGRSHCFIRLPWPSYTQIFYNIIIIKKWWLNYLK